MTIVYVKQIETEHFSWDVFCAGYGHGVLCRTLAEAKAQALSMIPGDGQIVLWLRSHDPCYVPPADLDDVFEGLEPVDFEYAEDAHLAFHVYAPRAPQ